MALLREVLRIEAAKDSLEVGPAGSRLKIYGDLSDGESFREKIDTALSLRAYALQKLSEEQEGGS